MYNLAIRKCTSPPLLAPRLKCRISEHSKSHEKTISLENILNKLLLQIFCFSSIQKKIIWVIYPLNIRKHTGNIWKFLKFHQISNLCSLVALNAQFCCNEMGIIVTRLVCAPHQQHLWPKFLLKFINCGLQTACLKAFILTVVFDTTQFI